MKVLKNEKYQNPFRNLHQSSIFWKMDLSYKLSPIVENLNFFPRVRGLIQKNKSINS